MIGKRQVVDFYLDQVKNNTRRDYISFPMKNTNGETITDECVQKLEEMKD